MLSHTRTLHAVFGDARPLRGLSRSLGHALGVWRQRRALAQLDDHLLGDLGLTRAEAEHEARRAVWDVPDSWRR